MTLPVTGDINDYSEQFEGMRVQFTNTLVVSEYFELARYGQIVLTEGSRPFQYSHTDNTPTVAEYSAYVETLDRRTIILDNDTNVENASSTSTLYPQPSGFGVGTQGTNFFRGGDTVSNLTGVLHWSEAESNSNFSTDAWRIRPTQADAITFTPVNTRPINVPDVGGNIKVASYNVLNYFTKIDTADTSDARGADSASELARQTTKLVQALEGLNADVFGLLEIANDGTTTIQYLYLFTSSGVTIDFLV